MASQSQSAAALISYVQSRLIVKQLVGILKAAGLPSSGVKKTLIDRLVDRIHELSRNNENEALEKLRFIIYNPDGAASGGSASIAAGRPNGYSSSPTNGDHQPYYNQPHAYSASSAVGNRVHFKPSPFYVILESLSPQQTIPVMTENRNTVVASIILNQHQVTTLGGKNARAMLYCGPLDAPAVAHLGKVEIGFPTPVEVKVNGHTIPANQLRGLKNKPGSTRPPDITQFLTKVVGHKNEVSITYALTQKKYAFVVNLVNQVPIEKLVQDLRQSNNKISKQTVIDDMIKRNQDSDLVATSSVMSLKCPLSTLRIETPVRSKICTHVQCFDAASFLQLQQQAPTWSCPSCSKPVPYEMLVVDSYVQDILDSTPKSVDSVTVDPNGNWTVASQRSPSAEMSPYSDDDEDVVEIHDNRPVRKHTSQPAPSPRPGSLMREENSRATSKRPISQVIDLTLSDDDTPARPAKRASTNQQSNSSSMNSSLADRSFPRNPISFPLGLNNPRTNGTSDLPHR